MNRVRIRATADFYRAATGATLAMQFLAGKHYVVHSTYADVMVMRGLAEYAPSPVDSTMQLQVEECSAEENRLP